MSGNQHLLPISELMPQRVVKEPVPLEEQQTVKRQEFSMYLIQRLKKS